MRTQREVYTTQRGETERDGVGENAVRRVTRTVIDTVYSKNLGHPLLLGPTVRFYYYNYGHITVTSVLL